MTQHPDGLRAALACRVRGGFCIFCEEPLPRHKTGRPNTITCGSRACTLAMQRAWHRDDHRAHALAPHPYRPAKGGGDT